MASLQVEFFGQTYIGTVRSLFTSMMVLSSAVGPALYGVIMDASLGYGTVFMVSIFLLVLVIIQSFRAIPTYSWARWKYKYKKYKNR